jgi:hypothetical protein
MATNRLVADQACDILRPLGSANSNGAPSERSAEMLTLSSSSAAVRWARMALPS